MSKFKTEKTEVPLSAMIDITFLLLSYFIITQTTPIEEAFISLNTVNISGEPKPDKPEPVSLDIHLQSDRYIVANRDYHNIQDLALFIKAYSKNSPDSLVNLKLSPKARTKSFVDLLDLLAASKLQENINIAYLKDHLSE